MEGKKNMKIRSTYVPANRPEGERDQKMITLIEDHYNVRKDIKPWRRIAAAGFGLTLVLAALYWQEVSNVAMFVLVFGVVGFLKAIFAPCELAVLRWRLSNADFGKNRVVTLPASLKPRWKKVVKRRMRLDDDLRLIQLPGWSKVCCLYMSYDDARLLAKYMYTLDNSKYRYLTGEVTATLNSAISLILGRTFDAMVLQLREQQAEVIEQRRRSNQQLLEEIQVPVGVRA